MFWALSQGNAYMEEHFSLDIKDEYRNDVIEYFSNLKNHKCIKLAREIAKRDECFSFDNPIRLAFSLNKNLQFDGRIEEYILNELDNHDLIEEFLISLVDFARKSKFVDFYSNHSNYYLSKIKEIKNLFNGKSFVSELEKFLKRKVEKKIQINIIPSLINANHGFEIENTDIANVGLLSEDFKAIQSFNNGYVHIIIHEICHCFVNCNTENNKLQIPEALKVKLKNYGYGNPVAYLNDTVVRAMTIRLRDKVENIDVEKFINKEHSFGFVYVKDAYQELLKYEEQNLSWEEYFPNLISFITQNNQLNKLLY